MVGEYCIRPTKRHQSWRKMSCFRPLRGRLWGVFNTPLRLGTCDSMKYRYNFPTGYVRSFKKWICFCLLRGRLWGVFNTPLRLGTCDSMKYRYNFPTGYVRSFKKWICFRLLRGRLWGVFNTPLRLGTCNPSKYRRNFPTGYVRPFKKWICFRPLWGRGGGTYSIRLYNWVRAIIQNTDAIPQPDTYCPFEKLSRFHLLRGRLWGVCDTPLRSGTCGPSKNCLVFVPYGAACGTYRIHPYDRVRVRVQKMDLYTPPSGPSVGRMRYAPQTGYVRPFKKLSRFRPLRGRLWGVCDTPLRSGTCGPSKNCPVFVPFGAVEWAYAIRPYDRVCAALQKTILFSSPSGPSVGRMRYAPTAGYM